MADIGFADVGYNIAFTIVTLWPAAVTWLNSTTTPILSDLVGLEWVQTRLLAFSAYNASDPISYSTYNSCNYVHTFLPNLVIAIAVVYILSRLWPFVSLLANLFISLLLPSFYATLLSIETLRFIMLFSARCAHAEHNARKNTESIGHVDAMDPRSRPAKFTRNAFRMGKRVYSEYKQKGVQRY